MANTQPGGVGNLAELFKIFGPSFFGSGTTTGTSTPDPEALTASRGISSAALSNASNAEGATTDIVNRIIRKNAIAFAPTASAAHVAGLYNDSTLKQLSTEAAAQSSAEASKAVLDYQTNQLGIAQRATSDQLAASRISTQRTAPQVSPLLSQGLGLGLAGISAYKNRSDIMNFFGFNKTPEAGAKLTDAATGEVAKDAGATDALSPSQEQTNVAFGGPGNTTPAGAEQLGGPGVDIAFDNNNVSVASGAEPGFTGAAGDTFAAETGGEGGSAIADAGGGGATDALTGEALDAASEEAGGALVDAGTGALAEDAGAAIGESFATEAAVEIGTDAALEGVAVAAAPETFGLSLVAAPIISAIIGEASIICAELKKQGLLSDSLARRSLMHFRSYKNVSREAYYIWAKPSVQHLRKNPGSLYSRMLKSVFTARCSWIAGRKNLRTALSYSLVSSFTIFVGLTILPIRSLWDEYQMRKYLKNLYRMY